MYFKRNVYYLLFIVNICFIKTKMAEMEINQSAYKVLVTSVTDFYWKKMILLTE